MNKIEQLKNENRRWTILRLLSSDPGHETESRLIQRGVRELNHSHDVGLAQIRDDLTWLDKRLLLRIAIDGDHIYAEVTQRGADVAAGRDHIDGVDAPPFD